MKKGLYILFLGILLSACARVGTPVGGKKDTLAPNFLRANIDSSRVNISINQRELRLYFDEYVMLKDISKNLVISPSIHHIKRIIPSNLANKYVLIQWTDTLKPNTTYNFNFGNAIIDLNEGNVLPYFNYAFSTGEYLDSLYISGEVSDGLRMPLRDGEYVPSDKNQYIVGLYRVEDGVNYAKKPDYITMADDDGYYEINFLKEGKYRILAFNDENQNSIFDEGKESVAFLNEEIDLKKSISGMKLKLFPSKKKVRYLESSPSVGGISLVFEGNPKKVEVSSQNEKLKEYKVFHRSNSDSVNIWFDADKQDIGIKQSEGLKFEFKADTLKGIASIFYKKNPKNELILSNVVGNTLPPNRELVLASNYPIVSLNTEKWEMKEDSLTTVDFSTKIDEKNPLKIRINAKFSPDKKYQLTIPKETVISHYKSVVKTYQFNFEVDKEENYGSLVLHFVNPPNAKFWVQLLDEQYKVKYSQYTDASKVKFTEMLPARYIARILVDSNSNERWDEVDFVNQIQAEPVYLFNKIIEIRQLWENVEHWDVKNLNGVKVPPLADKEFNNDGQLIDIK